MAHPIPNPIALPFGVITLCLVVLLVPSDVMLLLLSSASSVVLSTLFWLNALEEPEGSTELNLDFGDAGTLASSQILMAAPLRTLGLLLVASVVMVCIVGLSLPVAPIRRYCCIDWLPVSLFIRRSTITDLRRSLLLGTEVGTRRWVDGLGDVDASVVAVVAAVGFATLFRDVLGGWLRGPLTAERRGLVFGELENSFGETGS